VERVCLLVVLGIMLMVDSTVLAHVLSLLNQRYNYGLDLYLLSIDEGITGYRDDSLEVSPPSPLDAQANIRR